MIPLVKLFMFPGILNAYFALLLHYVSWGLPLCIFTGGTLRGVLQRGRGKIVLFCAA